MIVTNPSFGTTLGKTNPTIQSDDRYTNQTRVAEYKEIYPCYEQEMKQVEDNIGKPIRSLFTVGSSSGATEVLFIERCLDLLKPSGRMGIVLPEGVLNSSTLESKRLFFNES